jgi:hypothetical protein
MPNVKVGTCTTFGVLLCKVRDNPLKYKETKDGRKWGERGVVRGTEFGAGGRSSYFESPQAVPTCTPGRATFETRKLSFKAFLLTIGNFILKVGMGVCV